MVPCFGGSHLPRRPPISLVGVGRSPDPFLKRHYGPPLGREHATALHSMLCLNIGRYLCYNKEISNSVRRYLHQDVYIGKRQSGLHGATLYIKRIEAVRLALQQLNEPEIMPPAALMM